MAQKTVVVFSDDLDGKAAEETVAFGLDGISYEIDLSGANAARLRNAFAAYVGAGRRIGPTRVRRVGGPARTDREQFAGIRAWARGRGLMVSDRGRIPAHIIDQYHTSATAPEPEVVAAGTAEAPSPRRRAKKAGG